MIRVLVVAALPAVRAGLAALIQGESILVSGQRSALTAGPVGSFSEPAADVLLIDPANTSDIDEATSALPTASIVVLGPVDDESRLLDALAGRAWGYVPRDATGEQIVAAIQAVGDGLIALSPELANRIIAPILPAMTPSTGASDDLTPREREVLQLIALGLPNKTIANRLKISEHTVKFHVASILTRLGAASRTEAVRLGARRGLVTL